MANERNRPFRLPQTFTCTMPLHMARVRGLSASIFKGVSFEYIDIGEGRAEGKTTVTNADNFKKFNEMLDKMGGLP